MGAKHGHYFYITLIDDEASRSPMFDLICPDYLSRIKHTYTLSANDYTYIYEYQHIITNNFYCAAYWSWIALSRDT